MQVEENIKHSMCGLKSQTLILKNTNSSVYEY